MQSYFSAIGVLCMLTMVRELWWLALAELPVALVTLAIACRYGGDGIRIFYETENRIKPGFQRKVKDTKQKSGFSEENREFEPKKSGFIRFFGALRTRFTICPTPTCRAICCIEDQSSQNVTSKTYPITHSGNTVPLQHEEDPSQKV